jgi:hypothetical protein
MFAKGGLLSSGGWLAAISPMLPWLAGAAILFNPLKKLFGGLFHKKKRTPKTTLMFDDPANDMAAIASGSSFESASQADQSGRDLSKLFLRGMSNHFTKTSGGIHTTLRVAAAREASKIIRQSMGGGSVGNGVTLVNNINHPMILNDQSIDTITQKSERALTEKLQLRYGRAPFGGRERVSG